MSYRLTFDWGEFHPTRLGWREATVAEMRERFPEARDRRAVTWREFWLHDAAPGRRIVLEWAVVGAVVHDVLIDGHRAPELLTGSAFKAIWRVEEPDDCGDYLEQMHRPPTPEQAALLSQRMNSNDAPRRTLPPRN